MKTTTIQTKNVEIEIKEKAEEVVKKAGFSSLQDVIRIFIVDVANGNLPIKMDWRFPRDPKIREALEEHKLGKYKTILPGQRLSDVLG